MGQPLGITPGFEGVPPYAIRSPAGTPQGRDSGKTVLRCRTRVAQLSCGGGLFCFWRRRTELPHRRRGL